MCGICGTFHYASNQPVAEAEIRGMMDTIVHRGPDDAGVHLDGNLGLGFRRLAILDLSPAGHQPMSDPTGQVWVAFNGEIYNFKELRAELEGKGHRFRSHCDTEVIVLGFLEWGDAVLDRLEGMFGLAVWEPRRRRLLLARDQLGIKPVYYTLQGGTLHFGSEIRPILAALPTRPALDLEAAAEFLRYRYTPAPRTLHAGIHKLAAGEKLVVHQGAATLSRYYTFAPDPFAPIPRAEEAAEVTCTALNCGVVILGEPAPGTVDGATNSWLREPRLSSNWARQSTAARTTSKAIGPRKADDLRCMDVALKIPATWFSGINYRKR